MISKLVISNVAIATVTYYLWTYGFIDPFLVDSTGMIYLIGGFGVLSLGYTVFIAYSVAVIGNKVSNMDRTRYSDIRFFDNTIQSKISWIDSLSTILVSLGLLGTVVGISMSFYGIDPNSIGDSQAVKEIIGNLFAGLATAFNTTLAGTFLMIWLKLNRQIILGEVMKIRASVIKPPMILNE